MVRIWHGVANSASPPDFKLTHYPRATYLASQQSAC
jgi:hypothetical protein